MNYLRFNSQGVLLFTFFEKEYIITGFDDWDTAVVDIKQNPEYHPDHMSFQCSSSIDFPEESTDDQELIDLCYAIRNN